MSETSEQLRMLETYRDHDDERMEQMDSLLTETSGFTKENEDKIKELFVRFNHYVQSFNKVDIYCQTIDMSHLLPPPSIYYIVVHRR